MDYGRPTQTSSRWFAHHLTFCSPWDRAASPTLVAQGTPAISVASFPGAIRNQLDWVELWGARPMARGSFAEKALSLHMPGFVWSMEPRHVPLFCSFALKDLKSANPEFVVWIGGLGI